jgi:hypothetical protein
VRSVVVGIATTVGVLYYFIVYPRQNEEKNKQKELEKEQGKESNGNTGVALY